MKFQERMKARQGQKDAFKVIARHLLKEGYTCAGIAAIISQAAGFVNDDLVTLNEEDEFFDLLYGEFIAKKAG